MGFRLKTLQKIIKDAGIVTDTVNKLVGKINYSSKLPLSNGAYAAIPDNPFSANGAVNIMFQFRYYSSSPPGSRTDINMVIVYADVKNAYNDPKFISNSIGTIISYLKKTNPAAHLGNYGLSAHSAGYWPIENLLRKRKEMEQLVGKPLDSVFLADGGATKLNDAAMSGFVDFAQEAAKDPNKKFVVMHSAIAGGKMVDGKWKPFTSTTEHADYIANKLHMKKQHLSPDDPRFKDLTLKPKDMASKGGVHIITVDDDTKRPWYPKDKFKPGSAGWVHQQIGTEYLPYAWNTELADWN